MMMMIKKIIMIIIKSDKNKNLLGEYKVGQMTVDNYDNYDDYINYDDY